MNAGFTLLLNQLPPDPDGKSLNLLVNFTYRKKDVNRYSLIGVCAINPKRCHSNGGVSFSRTKVMHSRQYIVDSTLAALRLKPAEAAYGRHRLSVIPPGAKIEVQGDSATLSGMVEAIWNGQPYVVFPTDLSRKAHPFAA